MTTIVERISHKHNMGHLIFAEPIAKTYASAILLRDWYQRHDMDYVRATDWRYYFIVRRHFLRKKKRENGGFWICHYCQKKLTLLQKRGKRYSKPQAVTVDHKDPLAKGGDKLSTENMVECCSKCNQKKGNQSYEVYMKKLEARRNLAA